MDAVGPALLELHLALGNAEQACAVAVARAQREQAAGNYKVPWGVGCWASAPCGFCMIIRQSLACQPAWCCMCIAVVPRADPEPQVAVF